MFISRLLLAVALSAPMFADHVQIYKMRVTGPAPTDARLVLTDDQMVIFDELRPESTLVIRKSDLKSVSDVGGTVTLTSNQAFPGGSSTTYVMSMDPAMSNQVVAWFTAQPNVNVARGEIVSRELWVNVEHKHPVGKGCQGKLIASADGLQFVSLTEPAHSRGWSYSQVDKFEKYEAANEVKVDPVSGDTYNFKVAGEDSAKPIFNMISNAMASARR